MANTENIEARLCAYIDGELDAQERAEIEQHLVDHPQHRTLLAELTAQRALLRDLPRARAPEDLLESFHAQLERSVLLGSSEEEDDAVAGRINRWSQIWAAAAVLLLAVGLGVVIYIVVPKGPQNRGLDVAMVPTPAPATAPITVTDATPPTTSPALLTLARADDQDKVDRMKVAPRRDMPTGGAISQADVFAPARQPTKSTVEDELAGGGALFGNAEVIRNVQALAANTSNKSLVMVVSTDNPAASQTQVQNYLITNGLAWNNVPQTPANGPAVMPSQLNLKESQVAEMSRAQQTQVHLKAGMASGGFSKQQQSQEKVATTQPPAVQVAVTAAPAAPAAPQNPAEAQYRLAVADKNQSQTQAPAASVSAAPSTAPIGQQLAASNMASNSWPPLHGALEDQATTARAMQQLIVCRNLTPTQLLDLQQSALVQNSSTARFYDVSGSNTTTSPSTSAAPPVLMPSTLATQYYRARDREFGTRAKAPFAYGFSGATTHSAITMLKPNDRLAITLGESAEVRLQSVAADGTIALPDGQRVGAANRSVEELSRALQDSAAKDGKKAEKVSILVLNDSNSLAAIETKPQSAGQLAEVMPATTQSAGAMTAATAPAAVSTVVATLPPASQPTQRRVTALGTATTQPANEEHVDLVIVLQPEPPTPAATPAPIAPIAAPAPPNAAAAPLPATQPAATSPSPATSPAP